MKNPVQCAEVEDLDKLQWVPYDPRNAESMALSGSSLYVRFKRGEVYRYDGVPTEVWDALMKARGSGEAFVRLVRGRFVSTKVL